MKFADRLEIEERVELMNDLKTIITNGNRDFLPMNYRNLNPTQVQCLSNSELKGILFSYYSSTYNIESYKEMNLRLKQYLQILNETIFEEGFTIRERLLERELNMQRKDNER